MSIEQAILELAGAIRELAQANQNQAIATAEAAVASLRNQVSYAEDAALLAEASSADQLKYDQEQEALAVAKEAEIAAADAKRTLQEKAMAKVESERKASGAKQEITDALAKAKADKAAAKPAEEDDPLDAVQLDYVKDVKPKLRDVGKSRDELRSLLTEFGVSNGDQLTSEQYPKILARSNEILAARG